MCCAEMTYLGQQSGMPLKNKEEFDLFYVLMEGVTNRFVKLLCGKYDGNGVVNRLLKQN